MRNHEKFGYTKSTNVLLSGVAIQVASGAYAALSAKYIIFWYVISQNVYMYEDLRVKPTGMFVK